MKQNKKLTSSQPNKGGYTPSKVYKGKKFIPDVLSPNVISIIRLCLIPLFLLFFYSSEEELKIVAACIFALAAATDFVDGYIARKYNKVTTIGKFLDPIADKVLVATALIVILTDGEFMTNIVDGADKWLPVTMGILVSVIIARELIVSVFREIAAEKNVVLAAGYLGKVKTFVQDIAIVVLIVAMALKEMYFYRFETLVFVTFLVGFILFCVAALLTVVSGIEYVVTNKEVLKNGK